MKPDKETYLLLAIIMLWIVNMQISRYICIYAQSCRYVHNRMIFPRSTTLTEEFSTFQLSSSWLNKNCLRLNLFIFLSSLSSWVTFYPPHQIFNIPRLTMRRSTKMLSGFSARTMKVHFKNVVLFSWTRGKKYTVDCKNILSYFSLWIANVS